MSKRLSWMFVLLCCFVVVMLFLVQSRGPLPPQDDNNGQSPVTSAESVTDIPRPSLSPAQSTSVSQTRGPADEARSRASVSASIPEPSSPPPHPTEITTRLHEPPLAKTQPEAVSGQGAERQAEVWSYPPLLQQNASNAFVRAMEQLTNAKTEVDRYHALGNAAKSHFIFGTLDDARNYASELLSLDEKFKGEPWRDGTAVFDANLVLGRIAAQEGRLDEAKQYLLESGKNTGSPVLGSFGPNMGLAKDLLRSGERDVVLEYFELCRKFWTLGSEKLTLWSEDVKAGRTPDFEANLFY